MLTVDTPLGTLRASESDYYDHPGIWIEIQRRGQDDFCPLALVEYTDGEDEKMKKSRTKRLSHGCGRIRKRMR